MRSLTIKLIIILIVGVIGLVIIPITKQIIYCNKLTKFEKLNKSQNSKKFLHCFFNS